MRDGLGNELGVLIAAVLFAGCGTNDAQPGSPDAAPGVGGSNAGGAGGAQGGAGGPDGGAAPPDTFDPGTAVSVTLAADDQQALDEVQSALAEVETWTTADLTNHAALSFSQGPTYDPTQAQGMNLIQASVLALDARELSVLTDRGFVISDRTRFPNFVYGYELIYATDLPLYVSADSILHAVHQSFDSLLRSIEIDQLIPSLQALLNSMRQHLPSADLGGLGAQSRTDIDFYLTVAASLLSGMVLTPVAGADRAQVAEYLGLVQAEQGMVERELFGVHRIFDFSQFTVRGHYTQDPLLRQYFQAMMWLGRIDFRLVETLGEQQIFRRRQLEGALALRALIDDVARTHWDRIDRTVTAFTGVQDSMALPELDRLLVDLGVSEIVELAAIEDQVIAKAIIDGGYGKQQICSDIMLRPPGPGTIPLNRSFLLFGQRYIADSHVFSNVVWDRVPYEPPASAARGLPDPLDAAYAALSNNQAVSLLSDELETYEYAPELAKMRVLLDEHPPEYWESNLYNLWLGSLRALSPTPDVADPIAAGLPAVAGTEAWGRRILNTQLGSWAELRHDTLLYAKQSYTTGQTVCEYPDAYVEPYPAFFAALVRFAEHGRSLVANLGLSLDGRVAAYFESLRSTATILGEMAERQRSGAPHDPEHIEFINRAVRTHQGGGGCGTPESSVDAEGWYADLFLEAADRVACDPNIADVHTQPTTVPPAPAATVGYILHVGTALARPMVVTVDSCTGPRAYIGLASSYFEQVTEDFKRLTDEEWAAQVVPGSPEDVPWMQDLVVR